MKRKKQYITLIKKKGDESESILDLVLTYFILFAPILITVIVLVYSVVTIDELWHISGNEVIQASITETSDNADHRDHSFDDTAIGILLGYYIHYLLF